MAVLGLFVTGFAFASGREALRAQDAPLQIVGTWKPTTLPPGYTGDDYGAKIRVFAEPASRRLYALGSDKWLAAYDLDSFAPLGPGLQLAGSVTSYVSDPSTGGMFFGAADAAFFDTPTKVWIDYVGLRGGTLQKLGTIDLTTSFPGLRIVGMYRAPGTQLLWVIATGVNNSGVVIGEIDVSGIAANGAQLTWRKPIDGCPLALHGNPVASVGLGYVQKWNALYFGCGNASSGLTTSPNSRGAARLVLIGDPRQGPTTEPADFRLFPLPGDLLKAEASFDPGSDRLLIPAYTSSTGATLYVFDGRTNSYVGGVAMGNGEVIQAGVDAAKGRFYGLATAQSVGLIAADTRPTPIQQGISIPEFSRHAGRSPEFSNIAVDPLTSRIFLRYIGATEIVIVKDHMPPFAVPAPGDPDAATQDVEEEEGRTQTTYSGGVQGFGARYRAIGGIEGVVLNLAGFRQQNWPIGPGTREARFTPLDRLTVGNGESTAQGITATVDDGNTQGDLQKTQFRRPDTNEPLTESPLVGWPYHTVRCTDLGGNAGDEEIPAEQVKVTCNAEKALTTAALANRGADVGGIVFGPTSVNAKTVRDSELGTVAGVTSTADGISVLGGILQVGRVETTATATAKGRPGTASGSFRRVVKDVRLEGQILCDGNCGDLDAVAAEVNRRLSGRVRIDFPNPESLDGSPGGYQAVVERSRIEQIEQVMLNEQPADRLEVPGMVVSLYQDGAKSGRLIAEFAAVQAEARYGISLRDDVAPNITDPPTTGPDDLNDLGDLGAPPFGITDPRSIPKTDDPLDLGGPGGGVLEQAGRLIWNGLRGTLRLLPFWAVLLAPIYLSARRWLLLQRSTLGGSA